MRHGTYSIVARDPESGELGVAVQSHWFSVGSVVSWAAPGAGAVATQSVPDLGHGPRLVERLQAGDDARAALDSVKQGDELLHVRQTAIVDAAGRIAVHTGDRCIPFAGHETGDGFSCQANMMARDTVPGAMAAAYRGASGDLAERLMAALVAAEGEGGDVRGRQSAALLVVPAEGEAWQRRFDLRVEDHADPVGELQRVLRFARAYEDANAADERLAEGRHGEAAALYERAAQTAPEADELIFWAGLGIATTDLDAGLARVRQAAEVKPQWLELLERLSDELAPAAAEVRRALGR